MINGPTIHSKKWQKLGHELNELIKKDGNEAVGDSIFSYWGLIGDVIESAENENGHKQLLSVAELCLRKSFPPSRAASFLSLQNSSFTLIDMPSDSCPAKESSEKPLSPKPPPATSGPATSSSSPLYPSLPPAYEDPASSMERGCSPFCPSVVPLHPQGPMPSKTLPSLSLQLPSPPPVPSQPLAPPAAFLVEPSDEPLEPGNVKTPEEEAAQYHSEDWLPLLQTPPPSPLALPLCLPSSRPSYAPCQFSGCFCRTKAQLQHQISDAAEIVRLQKQLSTFDYVLFCSSDFLP